MGYKIAILKQTYAPDIHGDSSPYFADENYDTIADAQQAVNRMTSAVYITGSGESGRPELIIVDNDAELGYSDLSSYNWDSSDCTRGNDNTPCGECADCLQLIISQNRKLIRMQSVDAE